MTLAAIFLGRAVSNRYRGSTILPDELARLMVTGMFCDTFLMVCAVAFG